MSTFRSDLSIGVSLNSSLNSTMARAKTLTLRLLIQLMSAYVSIAFVLLCRLADNLGKEALKVERIVTMMVSAVVMFYGENVCGSSGKWLVLWEKEFRPF